MSTIEITPQLKVQMLKALVNGHDLAYAAAATETPRDRVLDIVSAHGYLGHLGFWEWPMPPGLNEQLRYPLR